MNLNVPSRAWFPTEMRPRVSDEREYIDEFQGFPGVSIEYVTAPGRGPFDAIEAPRRFESTFMRSSRDYLYCALEGAAAERGAGVLLEGEGGEYTALPTGVLRFMQNWPSQPLRSPLIREINAARAWAPAPPVRELARELLDVVAPLAAFFAPGSCSVATLLGQLARCLLKSFASGAR